MPLSCSIRATGTKTNGELVQTRLQSEPVPELKKFVFPDSFRDLKKVEFVLETTSLLSGLVDVDVDNGEYTLFKGCSGGWDGGYSFPRCKLLCMSSQAYSP